MKEVLTLFKPLADAKDLTIEGTVGDEVPELVYVDDKRLKQIGANLLGNAVKFTEKGGIKLYIESLNRNDGRVTLRFNCIDTGIGISEENIDDVNGVYHKVPAKADAPLSDPPSYRKEIHFFYLWKN